MPAQPPPQPPPAQDPTGPPAAPRPPRGQPEDLPAYPRHWEADVIASDGGIVHLRPILPTDADRLLDFHARLSDRTRYLRYFGPYPRVPPRDLERFTHVDHKRRVAFVCLVGDEVIAVGRYEGLPGGPGAGSGAGGGGSGEAPPESAEVAFVVRDDHQGRGLGSILLEHLAAAARENGLRRFEAEVLVQNNQMVRVFREAGYQVKREFSEGVLHLEFDIDPTEASLAVRDSREQRAEARSLHNLLHPGSVAVIGASSDPAKIGHAVLANLLAANPAGPVYPVNPEARSVRGVRAYASVTDIPDPVDLAVVAVPAAGMDEVMRSCRAKGVRALVVISAGFADAGGGGMLAQARLVTQARAHGMRVVGPNALGIANTDPAVRLNATLAPVLPGRGRVGFFSQSGALGTAILAAAAERGLGLSTFVSAGNRADVSGNDLLQYWQTDPATDLVLLYLETFGNQRKFARLARRLARTKPIVAVKSGRHPAPAAVPGAVPAPTDDQRDATAAVPVDATAAVPVDASAAVPIDDDQSVAALFEQAGVIRVATLTQLFDTALLLAYQPLPAGSRVAVVGNSTAVGLLVVDGLLDEGLEPLGEPIDVGAGADPERFAAAVAAAISPPTPDAAADALVVVFVPPIAVPGAAYARALREAVDGSGKPVVAVFLAVEGVPAELAVAGPDGSPAWGSVPSYPGPERAVAALARVTRYARWRASPVGDFTDPPGIDHERARAIVERECAVTNRRPADATVRELLGCYGIEVVELRQVTGADAAAAAAAELGFPVVVKAVGDRWRHRADLVAVRTDLGDAAAVRAGYAAVTAATGEPAVYVQRMAPKGISCVLEVVDDPSFGSLLSFGLSGLATELLGDRAYRVLPVSDTDAAALVRAPRAAPLLTGYGGTDPVRLDALEDLALRVGRIAEHLPEVRSLALDPVLASPEGAFVAGARIVLGPRAALDDTGPRRLT